MALITRSLVVIGGVELLERFDDALPNPDIRLLTTGAVGKLIRITAREQDGTVLAGVSVRPTVELNVPFPARLLRLVTGKNGTRPGTGIRFEFEVSR